MIKFHGGCIDCTQQLLHGTDFCAGCCYFDAEWDKPNLNNSPPNEADLERARVKMRLLLKKELER
jgi:hypothetical protein